MPHPIVPAGELLRDDGEKAKGKRRNGGGGRHGKEAMQIGSMSVRNRRRLIPYKEICGNEIPLRGSRCFII